MGMSKGVLKEDLPGLTNLLITESGGVAIATGMTYVFGGHFADGYSRSLGLLPEELGYGYRLILGRAWQASLIGLLIATVLSAGLIVLASRFLVSERLSASLLLSRPFWSALTLASCSLWILPLVAIWGSESLGDLAKETVLQNVSLVTLGLIGFSLIGWTAIRLAHDFRVRVSVFAAICVVYAAFATVGLLLSNAWGQGAARRVQAGHELLPNMFDPLSIPATNACVLLDEEVHLDLHARELLYLGGDSQAVVLYLAADNDRGGVLRVSREHLIGVSSQGGAACSGT